MFATDPGAGNSILELDDQLLIALSTGDDHCETASFAGGGDNNGLIGVQSRLSFVTSTEKHCHRNDEAEEETLRRQRQSTIKRLLVTSFMCIIFMIIEIVGGKLSHSLSLMTDAAHLLSDLAGFILSLVAVFLGSRRATKKLSFGYHRAEVLGAILSIFIIWLLAAFLIYFAIERIIYMNFEIDSKVMMLVAGLGMFFNLLMGISLCGGCCHSHQHQHHELNAQPQSSGHSHSGLRGHAHDNLNLRAAIIHVAGDLIQSVGVFIAALVIYFFPRYKIADPICTIIFGVIVLFTTINILRESLRILMEGLPVNLDYNKIHNDLVTIDGVYSVHSLHIWSLTVDRVIASVHLAVANYHHADEIVNEARNLLKSKHGVHSVTVQIEKFDPIVMSNCRSCVGPV